MQNQRRGASYKPKRSGWGASSGVLSVVPTEEQEQYDLAQYLDLKFGDFKWFHVPNGGMRNKIVAAKLKGQGTKKGVPDNFIIVSPPTQPKRKGVVIELKRIKGGRTSPEQDEWIASLEEEGWLVFVAKGCGEAIDIIERVYGKQSYSHGPSGARPGIKVHPKRNSGL